MAYNSQTRTAIIEHTQEHGLGNIVFHEVLGNTGPQAFALMCSVCCYQVQWSFNPNETLGLELDLLTSFCKNHLHGKEPLPQLSQPTVNEFNLLGDIKSQIGGTITAISSSSIKWVARKSNFNVDLQCRKGKRGPEYRATCEQCNGYMLLVHESVLALDRGIFSGEFQQFLAFHKHEAVQVELPKGRKFRHAGKQG